MIRNPFFFLAILLFMACGVQEDPKENTPFSDFLEYGSHEVGFKTLFLTDLSRDAIPYSDWEGRLYPTKEQPEGRTLPLHLWYPAVSSNAPIKYQHYIELITRQSEQRSAALDDSLAHRIYIDQTNALAGDSSFTKASLNKLLLLQTKASLDALAIENKFPLVIFPNGTSPANQSVLCEFLASHGYVVAGLPLKGQYAHVLDASLKGLEVGVDDLQFALQEVLKLPNVDRNQIALIANAIESSFCAGLASRNEKIKALVSLEGGFLSRFEQDILDETSFYEAQNMTLPILAIYAPHPYISPEFITHLEKSQRYFAHFPEMTEFHFLNFGVFEEHIPNIIGEAKGDTKKGFDVAAKLTLAFLNAKLKQQPEDLDKIYAGNANPVFNEAIDSLFVLDGSSTAPNMAIMKSLFISKGIVAIDSVYNKHYSQGNERPFASTFYKDFRNWLAWKKDPDYVNRKSLYELAVKSFPTAATHHYYLGDYLNKTGNAVDARKHYLLAKELLPTDTTIDQNLKTSLLEAIEEALK